MFGMLYGLSAVALYHVLGAAGVPTFYDKLLQVPILNLSVKLLDRASRARWLEVLDPARVGRSLTARQRHVAIPVGLGSGLRADEREPGCGRPPPGPVAAVLGTSVPGRTASCVRVSREYGVDLLQRGIRMGV